MPILPWVATALGVGSEIFSRSRAGYETSPNKRAFLDSVRNEERIFQRDAAYNSPAAQMARFKEAGLNPNLMYGQGTPGITSGTAVQAKGQLERPELIGSIMESMALGKDLEMKDAQIENIRANTKLISTKGGSEEWKQKRMEQDFNYLENNYPELMDKLRRENRIGSQVESYDVQKRQADSIHASQLIETELLKQGLMEKDGTIKSNIIEGGQFQNALLKMQKEFVEGGKMNATHFWQALMLLLTKSL